MKLREMKTKALEYGIITVGAGLGLFSHGVILAIEILEQRRRSTKTALS